MQTVFCILVWILEWLPLQGAVILGSQDQPVGAWTPGEPFQPGLARVISALEQSYDLTLLTAGNPAACFKRSQRLKETLPDLLQINPLEQAESMIGWLAVTAMVEKAVVKTGQARQAWELELVRLYRTWASLENRLQRLRVSLALMAVQPQTKSYLLIKSSNELGLLPGYARQGIRWLAQKKMPPQATSQLRRAILEGLLEVNRREGEFEQMYQTAVALEELRPLGCYAAQMAEALFELGKERQARQALRRAEKDASKEDLLRAQKRRQLAQLRRQLRGKPSTVIMAEVAHVLLELNEPWRVRELFQEDQVIAAGHPQLDEAYLRALFECGVEARHRWSFGLCARGRPYNKSFLALHIGAGLVMLMQGFFNGEDSNRLNPRIVAALQRELVMFRSTDERLTDLTRLQLALLMLLTERPGGSMASKALHNEIRRFRQAHPSELVGVQLCYLLSQLDEDGPDPWEVASQYRRALANRQAPAAFWPVYAGAAVQKAIRNQDVIPIETVMSWIGYHLDTQPSPELLLWRAHLLAVRAFMLPKAVLGARLREAMNAYAKYLRKSSPDGNWQENPQSFCDAVVSVATLLMHDKKLDQARDQLKQTRSACAVHPPWVAVSAVVDLASGSQPPRGHHPVEELKAIISRLPGYQARVQSNLWLALMAENRGDDEMAKEHYSKAASLLAKEEARGLAVPLAPDLCSLVALSAVFSFNTGFSSESPFGLAIELSATSRMMLFPPAAVSQERLQPYLSENNR